jgi:hypothetical protein
MSEDNTNKLTQLPQPVRDVNPDTAYDEEQIDGVIREVPFALIRQVLQHLPKEATFKKSCPGKRKIPSIKELKRAAKESLRDVGGYDDETGNPKVYECEGGQFYTCLDHEGKLELCFHFNDMCRPELLLWNGTWANAH